MVDFFILINQIKIKDVKASLKDHLRVLITTELNVDPNSRDDVPFLRSC